MRPSAVQQLSDRQFKALLAAMLLAGLALRLALTAATRGNVFDLGSLYLVAQTLVHHPLHLYAVANAGSGDQHWPYLPGYFPVILLVKGFSGLTGLGFEKLIRVPSALADLAIALLVQDYLRLRGAGRSRRLTAAALVVFGPTFVAISGVHGQIDSAATLPALAALYIWERDPDSSRRALYAGLLIGLGAAIKTMPGLMLVALLPSVRSRREAAQLVAATAAIPLLSALPYLIADGAGWLHRVLGYHGGIGLGGLGLVTQPNLALDWLHVGYHPLSGISSWLLLHGGIPAGVTLVLAAAAVLYLRAPAPLAACVLWLTVYAFGVSFFQQYMVWGLPFFLLLAPLRYVALLEALLLAPIVITYHGVHHAWIAVVFYVVPMIAVWALQTGALAVALRAAASLHAARRGRAAAAPSNPPAQTPVAR